MPIEYTLILLYSFHSDTLFMEDFNLTDFLESFHTSPCREVGGAMAPCYKCKDEGIIYY